MSSTDSRRTALFGVTLSAVCMLLAMRLAPQAELPSVASESALGSGHFFDDVAPSYDVLNRVISLGLDQSWRRAAVAAAGSGARALDVATGTGDLAALLRASAAFGDISAIDPSTEMLACMRTKSSVSGVHIFQGSAEQLPFEDASFDAVTVAFGVRNFADRPRGLAEIARVLRPHGRLVVLEASEPDGAGPMDTLARLFIRRIMPVIAAAVSGSPGAYRYLSDSMGRFPKPPVFQSMLLDAGLSVDSHKRLWPYGTGPDLYVAVKPSSETS
jgi:demethylmenaquinone methyltransferase / 2-methoxy-6-polyprenyl-1,4-benzoquinol methylase